MKIRRSYDRLFYTMGNLILIRWHHCTESGLCSLVGQQRHTVWYFIHAYAANREVGKGCYIVINSERKLSSAHFRNKRHNVQNCGPTERRDRRLLSLWYDPLQIFTGRSRQRFNRGFPWYTWYQTDWLRGDLIWFLSPTHWNYIFLYISHFMSQHVYEIHMVECNYSSIL